MVASSWNSSSHSSASGYPGRKVATFPVPLWVHWLMISLAGTFFALSVVHRDGAGRNFLTTALDQPVSSEYRHFPATVFPGKSWVRVQPETMGVDSRKLAKAISWFEEKAPSGGSSELAVVRHGRMIWAGENIERVHGTWSLTKAFSGTILAVLANEGICSPDTRVAEILPEMEAAYPEVTLGHLVTMQSGYEAAGDWPPVNLKNRNGGGTTPFTPSPIPQFAPATRYSYWDSAMNLYGLAITQLSGKSLESIFQDRIAGPIGIPSDRWEWGVFTQHAGIDVNGGSGNKGKHVEICAADAARFGLLMLNRGRWEDRQIIGASAVTTATSIHVPADLPLGGPIQERYGNDFPFDGRGVYGFNWWINGVRPDGERLWPGVPENAFGAIGFNNNRLFVLPEWDMVVVRLGQDGRETQLDRHDFAGLLKRIGRAIEN